MNKVIRTPLRYPGGKSKAIKYYKDYFPQCNEFREPFVGGGSVFLYFFSNSKANFFIINDINDGVASFWEKGINSTDEVVARVEKDFLNNKKSLYSDVIKRMPKNKIEEASIFFVLNRITFSGTTESGGYSSQAHEKRFTKSSIDRLKKLKNINNTKVYNKDFEEIITRKGKDVFIFLDPPYYRDEKSKLYGKNGSLHVGFDHIRLKNILSKTKHKWLLTYDNSDYIKLLYKDFNQKEVSLIYSMSKIKKQGKNELLISNFEL